MYVRFLLTALLILSTMGCGSSSSSTDNGSGSISAKLIWGVQNASPSAKTLFLTPAGVTTVRITVSGPGISSAIIKNFTTTPGAAGNGTLSDIPAGTGRTVKVEGLDSSLILRYLGTASADIVAGKNTSVTITMQAPVTTAVPIGGTYVSGTVTLTCSDPTATIYYTLNGAEPTTDSPSGAGTGTIVQIPPGPPVTLKYLAVIKGLYEFVNTQTYTVLTTAASPAGGSYSSPQSVTLTANVPATIYYTTNGTDPTTASPSGPSPLSGITVAVNSFLKFFATVDGVTLEGIKTESYHNP